MSTLTVLKEYLVGDGGYLLNDDNNGKTVMLSGAWGSGKTHFWQNEIIKEQKEIQKDGKTKNKYTKDEYEEGLSYKLNEKKKACVYVSLYGKPSMESIELDLYMNAYKNIEGDADFISKTCSVFTSLGKNLGNMAHRGVGSTFEWLGNLVDKDKLKKAGEYLGDGGLICFDDFERKSKDIDLNDLFGFISQLTLEYNCKVVIILNSDVFKGKEKEIFSQVKEKTVSKYLFFNPSVEELFDIIFKEYDTLKEYEDKIKSTFKEVGIVNARIYNQVLDNIQEWIIPNKSLIGDGDILRYFVLVNINFILTHHMVQAELGRIDTNALEVGLATMIHTRPAPKSNYEDRIQINIKNNGLEYDKVDEYIRDESNKYSQNFIENLMQKIKDKEKSNTAKSGKYDNSEGLIEFINNNQSLVKSLYFMYAFQLDSYGFSHNEAEVQIMNSINNFIETGIV